MTTKPVALRRERGTTEKNNREIKYLEVWEGGEDGREGNNDIYTS